MRLHYDLQAEVLRRQHILSLPVANQLAYCTNPVDWINTYCWTYDPRLEDGPKTIPFLLFPKQAEYILWAQNLQSTHRSGCIVKPRDMGVTWLNASLAVWYWLFTNGAAIKFSSKKAQAVDRLGNPDTIFEKIRIVLRYLPGWMRPSYADNLYLLKNDETGSTIAGEWSENAGRGGRGSIYFADEFAFMQHLEAVESAISQNSETILYASTYNRPDDLFAKKVEQLPTFRFNWRDDPRKDQEWYDEQVRKLQPEDVAREIDCNPNPSKVDRTFSAFTDDLIQDPPEDQLYDVLIGIDHGENAGKERAVLVYSGKSSIYVVDEYKSDGATTPEEDHAGILRMLSNHGLTMDHVDTIVGDTNSAGKQNPGRKLNDLFANLFGRKVRSAKKGPGSVAYGNRVLNYGFRRQVLFVSSNCKDLLISIKHWQGQDNELKDIVDALKYAVVPVLEQRSKNDEADRILLY